VLDRAAGRPVIMASAAGGMDIEEVAEKTAEKIVRVYIDPGVGIVPFEARQLGFGIGLDGAQVNKFVKVVSALYDAYLPPTRRCSKSTRWWSPRAGSCSRSTRR